MSQTEAEVDYDNLLHQCEVTKVNNNIEAKNHSKVMMSSKFVCRYASAGRQLFCVLMCKFLLAQCTTGSSQRSIIALTTGRRWRSEEDLAKRIEPNDDFTEKRCVLRELKK